jgi:hypothetical protein
VLDFTKLSLGFGRRAHALLLALTPTQSTPAGVAVDAINVTSGCAADYDGWLPAGAA